ncbi:MAG: acyltransferase [Micropepsaceae bacterium]
MTSKPVLAIDGLRGVAALGIVIYHMRPALAYAPELRFAAHGFEKYFLLLDLFFVVSGFAIASGYGETFRHRITGTDYRRFLWGRFARLYPLYFAILLVLAAQETFYLVAGQQGWLTPPWQPWGRPIAEPDGFIASLFLVQAWGFLGKLVWIIPAWYVSALVAAYLVFPLIARAAAGLPERSRGLVLVGLAGAAALALHIAYQAGAFPGDNDWSPVRAILEFTLGYGLAQLPAGPAWRRYLQLPLLILVFAGLHVPFRDEITLVFLVAFFWSLLDDRGVIAAPLKTRPAVWLGSVSYAVFLIHQPMLNWFDGLNNTPLAQQLPILWEQYFTWNLALRVVLIVAAGWLAHRFIAVPAQRWLDPRKARPPSSGPAAGRSSR